jgi:hypothetical protein
MSARLGGVLWSLGGAVGLGAVLLVVFVFQPKESAHQQFVRRAQRQAVAGRIRLSLATAAEAEKSAVLAITDRESQDYADQARAATAEADKKRQELSALLAPDGSAQEKELLAKFSEQLVRFQQVDKEILELAVRNTNLKAAALAFGPAATAIGEMDAALSSLIEHDANLRAVRLASGALTGAQRIQALLPPHIAEKSDAKMDALEAQMRTQDEAVRRDLKDLAAVVPSPERATVEKASAAFARFDESRREILKLSRENTNVRSLDLSLSEKRKVTLAAQDALAALEKAIADEPMGSRPPVSPR